MSTPTLPVLGVPFFTGTAPEAVDFMLSQGGLLVVPAAPALKTISEDPEYRRSLLEADLVITDSGYMVLLWNLVAKPRLTKLSGLAYLREFLARNPVKRAGTTFWVMAGKQSADKNLTWLSSQGIDVPESHVYMAPMYGKGELRDEELLRRLEELRPAHIVVTVGGGTQERLGLYLRDHLSYRPGIHCIGAAIAFLSGDQVNIPEWADKLYLGWFFRTLAEPRRYAPRYWGAMGLASMIWKHRENLPPLKSVKS